jgi:hypothetical protein
MRWVLSIWIDVLAVRRILSPAGFFMQIKTFIERERLFRFLSGATAVS